VVRKLVLFFLDSLFWIEILGHNILEDATV